jgi:hypothetical protein
MLTALTASFSFSHVKKIVLSQFRRNRMLSLVHRRASPVIRIRFFGNNLDKVTEIDFTGASVTSDAFVSKTKTEIHVTCAHGNRKGYVTLKTPPGDYHYQRRFNIGIAATVSSITCVARPGANITIKGDYLTWVTAVSLLMMVK